MAEETKEDESRLALDELLSEGLVREPARIIVYGVPGVGKTRWATLAPDPVVISAERGTNQLRRARRIEVKTWEAYLAAFASVFRRQHGYRTLVVDGIGALEVMLWAHLCRENRVSSIEKIESGYGKGFNMAVEKWSEMTTFYDRLAAKRGMNVVLVGHADNTVFNNPEGQNYNRFNLSMHQKSAQVLFRWANAMLFMGYDAKIIGGIDPENEKGRKEIPGKQLGNLKRIMTTVRGEGKEAKNRYEIPDEFPAEDLGDPLTGKGSDAEKFWQSIREYLPEGMV